MSIIRLSRERVSEGEIKELAHTIVEVSVQNLQGRPTGWQSREGTVLHFKSEGICWQNPVFFTRESYSTQAFNYLDDSTHIAEHNWLYSRC